VTLARQDPSKLMEKAWKLSEAGIPVTLTTLKYKSKTLIKNKERLEKEGQDISVNKLVRKPQQKAAALRRYSSAVLHRIGKIVLALFTLISITFLPNTLGIVRSPNAADLIVPAPITIIAEQEAVDGLAAEIDMAELMLKAQELDARIASGVESEMVEDIGMVRLALIRALNRNLEKPLDAGILFKEIENVDVGHYIESAREKGTLDEYETAMTE